MKIGDKVIFRLEEGAEAYLFTTIRAMSPNGVTGQFKGEIPYSLIVAVVDSEGKYTELQKYGKARDGIDCNCITAV